MNLTFAEFSNAANKLTAFLAGDAIKIDNVDLVAKVRLLLSLTFLAAIL